MASEKTFRVLRFVVPVAVVLAAVAGAVTMVALKPDVEKKPPEVLAPLVRVETVKRTDVRLVVVSQGTVRPRTESQLVPEVSGKVTWVSDSFASGGFFEQGEALVKIDPFDHRQALTASRSELARAELRLAQEEAEAKVARREWEELGRARDGNPLTLREPQLQEARAAVDAAKASVERAERNLERTEIRAPYAGRVRQKSVDVGQFVTTGAPIATIYAVDAAEIRLPLPDAELAFVDLPLTYRGNQSTAPRPRVVISASFGGERYEWEGRVVRTEGEIDPRTRMILAVAEVRNPYAPGDDPRRPPLSAGMFVEASIQGRLAEDVSVLPRSALRPESRVWVVLPDGTLRFRDVEVLRATEDEVLIARGLSDGELVCVSALEVVTDGMRVRIAGEEGKSL